MKPARLIILAVAVVAAGLAGLLAMNMAGSGGVVTKVQSVIEKEPTVNVLVSSANLPVGARLDEKAVHWMAWPQNGVVQGFITETDRPDAIKDLQGAVVRLPVFEGEPIRPEKVADSNSRILSSLLPAGKRAVATEISVATGAGGFILPNDRVDVIMVRKGQGTDKYITETVLSNVRVLAIDQQIEEKEDGTKASGRHDSNAGADPRPDQGSGRRPADGRSPFACPALRRRRAGAGHQRGRLSAQRR